MLPQSQEENQINFNMQAEFETAIDESIFVLPDRDGKALMIFEMNEYDWWVDYHIEAAIVNYTKFKQEVAQLDLDEIEINAHALRHEEASKLKFGDDNITRTFAEQLDYEIKRGDKFPCFFASTEW
jgi:hypothetical protein